MTQSPSYGSTVDSFLGLFDLCSTTVAWPEAIAGCVVEAGPSPFSPEAICNRVFALAWNAPTALTRFTTFVLEHHTELAAYETLPVSNAEDWICDAICHLNVTPENLEAVVERLQMIWNRFGGFRGAFGDLLNLVVAAVNAVGPSGYSECRELTQYLSDADSCRIVNEMVARLQPSIDAGKVDFDLMAYAHRDLPGAVTLCYLWQMQWLTRAEIAFPSDEDIAAFSELRGFRTPVQESAAFRTLGFWLQVDVAYKGRLQEKLSNAKHPFAEYMAKPSHSRRDSHSCDIVEINAEGAFVGIVGVRGNEITANRNSVPTAAMHMETGIGAISRGVAEGEQKDAKPKDFDPSKAGTIPFGLQYDRKHFDLTRQGRLYEGLEQRLTQREHEIFVLILDAQDCKIEVRAMKGNFLGTGNDLSEGKRKLNEKLSVFDLRIPDVRTEKVYRIVDDSAIPHSS